MILKPREDWTHLDSSKIADYCRCPRYFFFRHIIGVAPRYKSVDLVFGEAWHRAQAHIFEKGFSKETLSEAMTLFNQYFRQHFPESNDLDNAPKNPGFARIALEKMHTELKVHDKYKVVEILGKPATELYGTVPISDNRVIQFRIDVITERLDNHKVIVWDHKTTRSDRAIYQMQWQMSNQMLTYYHAVNSIFGPENVHALYIDLVIMKKSGIDFQVIPIMKQLKTMDQWLWNINRVYDLIESDIETLTSIDQTEPILQCFHCNDRGCIAYNRLCCYYDYCLSWPNPLLNIEAIKEAFEVNIWDPAKVEEGSKYIEISGIR